MIFDIRCVRRNRGLHIGTIDYEIVRTFKDPPPWQKGHWNKKQVDEIRTWPTLLWIINDYNNFVVKEPDLLRGSFHQLNVQIMKTIAPTQVTIDELRKMIKSMESYRNTK